MTTKTHKGFTVLELLIVIGIMCILIALVLVGLNAARRHSADEDKASNVQTMVVGLVQYFNICREYPSTLDGSATCPDLAGKTLKDLIPDIASYSGNPDYSYAGIADPSDPSVCSGFHLGVKIEGGDASFTNKSAATPSTNTCTNSGPDFDGSQTTYFDIKK